MTIYDTRAASSNSRFDVSGLFALVVILAVLGTLVLDAYAFSTLNF